MANYYTILGLPQGASKDAVKKAYRRLAMQYHPDKNPSPDAKQKFILLTEAYDGLMEGKKFSSFTRTNKSTASPAPKAKSREDIRREKMAALYETFQKRFLAIRNRYTDPVVKEAARKKVYFEINFLFVLFGLAVIASILYPFLAGNAGLLIFSFPAGMVVGARCFMWAGRKKLKADMVFGEDEYHSFGELRDFFSTTNKSGIGIFSDTVKWP
jgi:hypothetical protein